MLVRRRGGPDPCFVQGLQHTDMREAFEATAAEDQGYARSHVVGWWRRGLAGAGTGTDVARISTGCTMPFTCAER